MISGRFEFVRGEPPFTITTVFDAKDDDDFKKKITPFFPKGVDLFFLDDGQVLDITNNKTVGRFKWIGEYGKKPRS